MKKIYLKDFKICKHCGKKRKSFVIKEDEEYCMQCFMLFSSREFIKNNKNNRLYGKSKPFPKRGKKVSKKIYAINGITTLYNGGCFN
jgi:hypothetical protein